MCAHYTVLSEEDVFEMRKIIDEISKKFGSDAVKSGGIRPTDTAPVIKLSGARLAPYPARWSYRRRDGGVVFNTRAETVLDKPASLRLTARCVIPSLGFYEWAPLSALHAQMSLLPDESDVAKEPKQRLFFTLPDSPILYMAGLVGVVDGADVFTILTTVANRTMSRFHDRMPVILSENECFDWVGDDAFAHAVLTRQCAELDWRIA